MLTILDLHWFCSTGQPGGNLAGHIETAAAATFQASPRCGLSAATPFQSRICPMAATIMMAIRKLLFHLCDVSPRP